MIESWQLLIVVGAVAAAGWWAARRVIRFARALRNPGESAACGGCEHCPTTPAAQTVDGKPIVDLRVEATSRNRPSAGHLC